MLRRTACVMFTAVPVWLAACVSDSNPQASAPPSCETYCTEIQQKCGGPNRQYRGTEECMKVCTNLELGTRNDGDVNSVGCRLRQMRAAATLDSCIAAGPFGGDVCGTRCSNFCRFVGKSCLAIAAPPYGGSEGTCIEACPSFRRDAALGDNTEVPAFPGADTFNCRSHHLILALSEPEPHCSHADAVSPLCK